MIAPSYRLTLCRLVVVGLQRYFRKEYSLKTVHRCATSHGVHFTAQRFNLCDCDHFTARIGRWEQEAGKKGGHDGEKAKSRRKRLSEMVATVLDRRVHSTTTLGWSRDDLAQLYMQHLVRFADLLLPRHGWRVLTMREFYPRNKRLLGLNVNMGQSISIRFRDAENKDRFLPLEEVTCTMLHELCHCAIGPHNKQFWALYETLVAEAELLPVSSSLFSSSQQTPGMTTSVPRHATAVPPKRQGGGGRRLGGATPLPGSSPLDMVRQATVQRHSLLEVMRTMRDRQDQESRRARATAAPAAGGGGEHHTEEEEEDPCCSSQSCPSSSAALALAGLNRYEDLSDDPQQRQNRKRPRSEREEEEEGWLCDRCGFRNHPLLQPPNCEMCYDEVLLDADPAASTENSGPTGGPTDPILL